MSQAAPAAAADDVPAMSPGRLKFAAFVLALSNFIVVLDMTVANVSVPHIAGSLGVSLDQGTWVITSYAVAEALTVPLTGWLSQRFGTVKLYLLAMTGFGIFSLLCGLSQTLEMIVICRIGQGMCGGLLMPLAQTHLLRIHPMAQRPKAMLIASMTTLLGPALGPNVGGLISDEMSWHWIFLINLPIVAFCVVAVYALLGKAETPVRKVPIDTVGLALMVTWIGALQFMLDLGRNRDWFSDPLILALGLVALIAFIAFIIWELTEEHPVVNLRIFRYPQFSFGVVALSLCFGGYFASIVVIPQWLQTSMGYPALWAGFITSCTALAALTTSRLAAKAVAKGIDPRILVSCAIAWLGCMALLRAQWTSETDFWTLAMPQIIQGFGMAFFMLPLTMISLNAVRPDELPSATGIQNFVRTLSVGVATAVALTYWSDSQQAAQTEIASKLQPDEALRSLSAAGMSHEQAAGMIARLAEREAVTMAVDQLFLATAAVFFLGSLVVMMAPKPKPPGAAR